MNKLIIFLVLLTMSCAQNNEVIIEEKKDEKSILLKASFTSRDLFKVDSEFTIYTDTTFVFTEKEYDFDHERFETFTGKLVIKGDTIHNFISKINNGNTKKIVLKNGFVFLYNDKNFSFKLKIDTTNLPVKNYIDIGQFPNYAVFDFYKHKEGEKFYEPTTKDLKIIEELVLKKHHENRAKLGPYNDYIMQVEVFKNIKDKIIARVNMSCNDGGLSLDYEFYQFSVHDGGNCNVYFEIDITNKKVVDFNIAGMA